MTGHSLAWSAILGLLLLWQPAVADSVKCKLTSTCYFDCGNTVMDLTPLKTFVFKDVIDAKGQNQFSYGPCATFSEGTGCSNTHVCQVADILAGNTTIDVGSTVKASLTPSHGPSYLTYSHTSHDGVTRTTKVTLKCPSANEVLSQDPHLRIAGESPADSGHYEMTMTSHHACFVAKPSTTPKPATTATTKVTTEVTTTARHNATTQPHHVTTEQTTPSKGNVTTQPHKVTTHHTTPASKNVTTASHNATTEHTTPASKNVTTASHNATTEHTTPASKNVTTASHNATTEHTTPASKNVTTVMTTPGKNATSTVQVVTTANVTIPGPSHQTTQAHDVTTTSGADTSRIGSEKVTLALLITAVTALVRL